MMPLKVKTGVQDQQTYLQLTKVGGRVVNMKRPFGTYCYSSYKRALVWTVERVSSVSIPHGAFMIGGRRPERQVQIRRVTLFHKP